MKSKYILFPFFTLLIAVGSLYAQPPGNLGYEPPPGWEYVRNLDSIFYFKHYAHNDSLFSVSMNIFNGGWKLEHSIDGGKIWLPNTLPQNRKLLSFAPGNIEGTTILLLEADDTVETLIVSTDLGQTWQDRAKMANVPTSTEWKWSSITVDPHHPHTNWFAIYQDDQSGREPSILRNMYFTTDGGYTWKFLSVPHPSLFGWNSNRLEIRFDYRDSGAWYFISTVIYESHFGDKQARTGYYVSHDHGETFEEIPVIGDFIGVNEKEEQWLWAGEDKRYNTPIYTAYKTIDSNQIEKNVELLKQILPYKYPLDTSYEYGHYHYIEVGAKFFPSDPLQSVVSINEFSYDHITNLQDTVYFDTTWLYYTKDLKNFEPLWLRPNRGRIGALYLDAGSGYVYLVSLDTPAQKVTNNGSYYLRQSLWKRKVFTTGATSVKQNYESDDKKYASIYWDAVHEKATVSFTQAASSHTRIVVYDILGREVQEVYKGMLSGGEHKFALSGKSSDLNGTLFVRIEQPSFTKTIKFFIHK